MSTPDPVPPDARGRRFRQAAFCYLHVGILYEFVVFVLWRRDLLPAVRGGGAPVWLAIGALITLAIFWGLWFKQSRWLARGVWFVHALRLPAIIDGAFFPSSDSIIPQPLWLVALPIVLINLWLLARADWDL